MKFNPFRPGNIVGPGMFVGRLEELDTIEQALFQAKHGNPHHFLIEGERGIGKSSLLFMVEAIAAGTVCNRDDERMNFLTVSIDMSGVETQLDIVRAIGRQLRSSLSARQPIKERAVKVWDFLQKWEIMGVRFHQTQVDEEDARDELVNRFVELIESALGEIDGVFIIIDEADAPSADANLGEFLKLFTERLTRRNCSHVLLGLAGLPSTISKLRASHESSPRVVEVLHMEPLSTEECKRVVEFGLEDANKKNGFETTITTPALGMIAELSEGYPHFIQQFAHSAFAEDEDTTIDVKDVMQGAYKENGALMQLGHKYFSEMYHAKISSEDYRSVLGAMAAHGDTWLQKKEITRESGVSETNVTNALTALKNKNIILAEEGRRGMYRLPTKSFAAWITAIRAVQTQKGSDEPGLFSSGA